MHADSGYSPGTSAVAAIGRVIRTRDNFPLSEVHVTASICRTRTDAQTVSRLIGCFTYYEKPGDGRLTKEANFRHFLQANFSEGMVINFFDTAIC